MNAVHQQGRICHHETRTSSKPAARWHRQGSLPCLGNIKGSRTKLNAMNNRTSVQASVSATPFRSTSDLVDPAHIGAIGKASAKVKDHGGDVSLSAYMQLPIEQYFVLNPSQITFIGGSRFQLHVPRINIFNLWIEPVVQVSVRTESNRVVLEADNCRIRGCEAVERLKLDERFCMRFVTKLTWRVDAPAAAAGSSGQPEQATSSVSSSSLAGMFSRSSSSQVAQLPEGEIVGDAKLDVWSETLPPFNLMPRAMMESTCNAVMRGLVSSLLPLFMRQLAADYGKWATDEAYRAERAARSKPLVG